MRGRLVAAVVVALVLAPAALAASEAPSLEPAASWVAGKQVRVYCAQEYGEGGHAIPGGAAVYVDFEICGILFSRAQRTGDEVAFPYLVNALTVLAHEARHASGLRDESATDCSALKFLPGMASRFFGFRTWAARHALMTDAWQEHAQLPPEYRTLC